MSDTTMIYGNLADAPLGDRRFAPDAGRRLHAAAGKAAALKPQWRPSPAARQVLGLALAVIGLAALAVLGTAPDRFAAATPSIADLEAWLIRGDGSLF